MVIDCLMLYMEYNLEIMAFFKTLALVTVYMGRDAVHIEPFFN